MDWKLIHFYPDLMNLYGSYANLSVLRRSLEGMGGTVQIKTVQPGEAVDLDGADFLFMGAGTERRQRFALADFRRWGEAVKAAAVSGTVMLFAGTAMDLLGSSITAADGTVYPGLGLADFTVTQGKQRTVEDICGHTDLYSEAVVGFLNTASTVSGVKTPLVTSLTLGRGNAEGKEGYHHQNVYASHLTGPLLVKNPRMLESVVSALYRQRGAEPPAPVQDPWAEKAFAVTAEQLQKRAQR